MGADPDDLVRREVESALRHSLRPGTDLLVIPVLVDGAAMPDPSRLPPSMQPLCRLQSAPLRNPDWTNDISRLVAAIGTRVASAARPAPAPAPPRPTDTGRSEPPTVRSGAVTLASTLLGLAVVATLVAGLGYGGYRLFQAIEGDLLAATDVALSPSSGPPGTEVLVTATGYPPGQEVRFQSFFSDQNAVVVADAQGTATWRVVLSGGFGPNTERITAQSEGLSDQADATFVYTS